MTPPGKRCACVCDDHAPCDTYARVVCRHFCYRKLKLDSAGNRIDTDGVKLYCGDMGKRIADRAIQTLGGYGYVGEYNVERLWRDSKLLEIGGGTNESHHKNMVRDLERMDRL